MKAADIMITEVVTIESSATISHAAKVMKQNNLRSLIVERSSQNNAYGIITTTDISNAIAQDQDPYRTYVYEVMTKPCIVVSPNMSLEHIARLFARAKIRLAPVIKDRLLGVVSLTDILTKTNYLTSDKMKAMFPPTTKENLSSDSATKEWEVVDWEVEL